LTATPPDIKKAREKRAGGQVLISDFKIPDFFLGKWMKKRISSGWQKKNAA
jgi:hypothetical protein